MATKKPDAIIEDGAVYVMQAGTPVYLKTADVCAMTGKTNQWIGQLVSQGVLHKRNTPHGAMFDMTSAMRDYCDMLENRTANEKSPEEVKREEAISAANMTMRVSKAKIAQMQMQELQGKMHRSEDVEAMTEDLIYTMRAALISLPGRLAKDVAAVDSPAEAAEVIRKEVYKLMRELANYRYDPKKYESLVRERMSWDIDGVDDDDE